MGQSRRVHHCRLCQGPLSDIALSLGEQPISNRLPRTLADALNAPVYPLDVVVCTDCGLPQLAHDLDASDHFHDDYTYISGASATWVDHCGRYAQSLVNDFNLSGNDLVVEAGSNDGTLLKEFAALGVRVLGVEPSGNVAQLARDAGVTSITAFFNDETAGAVEQGHGRPRAFIGNNVLAHVPDTHGFLCAARDLIAEDGFLCFEFPHFTRVLTHRYFDTIYHEHYAYLGVAPLAHWAERNAMTVFDVKRQPTHGGSLRVFLKRNNGDATMPAHVRAVIDEELALAGAEPWRQLGDWLAEWRTRFRTMMAELADNGETVAGYAAASKATVISNYLGLTGEDVAFCSDASALKQGRFIPGAGIPILGPEALTERKPDAVIAYAWNIFDEIAKVVAARVQQPTKLIRPLPDIEVTDVAPTGKK